PQARQAQQRDDDEIGADVLQILVAVVRAELVVGTDQRVTEPTQRHHAGDMDEAERDRGQQVARQAVPPGIDAERPTAFQRDHERDQRQDQEGAAELPHPGFPRVHVGMVGQRNQRIESGVEDDQGHPEADFDGSPPALEIVEAEAGAFVHPAILRKAPRPVPAALPSVPVTGRSVTWRATARPEALQDGALDPTIGTPLPLALSPVARALAGTRNHLSRLLRRVRPGDPAWPDADAWETLRQQVGGRLLKLQSPFAPGATAAARAEALAQIKNPFYVGDNPALTQTSGWLDAWASQPSTYAVAAESTADVVAAVNFARRHHLRLVVKGGGHSYQGTSNAPDSLLVWTRP